MGLRDIAKKATDAVKRDLERSLDSTPKPLSDAQKRNIAAKAKRAEDKERRQRSKVASKWHLSKFLGSTEEVKGLVPGAPCRLVLADDGLHVSPGGIGSSKVPILSIPWSAVLAAQAEDASEQAIRTKVRQHGGGGLSDPLLTWRTMPVPEQKSEKLTKGYLEVQSEKGDFLFEVSADAREIQGRLMATRKDWAQPA